MQTSVHTVISPPSSAKNTVALPSLSDEDFDSLFGSQTEQFSPPTRGTESGISNPSHSRLPHSDVEKTDQAPASSSNTDFPAALAAELFNASEIDDLFFS